MKSASRLLVYCNAALIVAVSLYFFALPSVILLKSINDPGLKTAEIPRFTFDLHKSLTERMERWARERVVTGQAEQVNTYNISGTEWPIFGSVFYLWATESLQEAWLADPTLASEMPTAYASGAIDAVTALIADPNHATWVKDHWGADYLERENLFYRMLLISGLTSYQKLTGETRYQMLLTHQVESLSQEIDASPYGLLDDYPGECYPIDIMPAIAAIQRADAVLGTDHSARIVRALRAFEGAVLDPNTQLPTYVANSKSGQGFGSARGIGASFMLIWAPEVWQETAQQWYVRYDEHFWQADWFLAGFREFPQNRKHANFWLDVDAGPVLFGYGTAASAFGIGAARVNGRFEQAYPLSAEALVASWPLPNGTLLLPRLLSDFSDAPYVGEAALLFNLTRKPIFANQAEAGKLPFIVWFAIAVYVGLAVGGVWLAVRKIAYLEKSVRQRSALISSQMIANWLFLVALGLILILASWQVLGGLFWVAIALFPWEGYIRHSEKVHQ
jgi:hypothetical protein